jgi:predicted permease
MSVVQLLIDVMGPVVAIVAVGWFAGARMPFEIATLSRLAFWVLGPAFVFDAFITAELSRDTIVRLVVAAWLGMAAAAAVGFAAARAAGLQGVRRDAILMTSAYGNVGNAGLAISVFAFGEAAAPIAAVLMITINSTGMAVAIALASARSDGLAPAVKRSLAAPMTVAALAALLINVFDIGVPLLIGRSTALVGGALIPVMLLTLGMQLAQNGIPRPEIDAGVVGLSKLVVAPLVAGLAGAAFGLTGDAWGILVLQSAMPPAVFCVVVALEYDMEPDRVIRTVVGSTLLALATLPIALLVVT